MRSPPGSPVSAFVSPLGPETELLQRRDERFVLMGALDGERAVYLTFGPDGYDPFVVPAADLPDAASLFPAAASYQGEARELFGLAVAGQRAEPGTRGSFVPVVPPRPGRVAASPLAGSLPPLPEAPYRGDAVLRVPFGPVRDGTVESLLHRFHYLGERVLSLEQHLGFKHRAAEARAVRATVDTLPLYAERMSGPGSVAYALAVCQAVEAGTGLGVPPRAQALRAVLAELERVYNHFRDIGRLASSTTLRVGAAHGHALQEWTQRVAAQLTGHRYMRGMVSVGGLRRDIDVDGLGDEVSRIEADARAYVDALEATELFVDRLETTGVLASERARAWGAVGPVGRASGVDVDLRREAAYGAYRELSFGVPGFERGDALARFRVRCEEILVSLYLVRELADGLREGSVRTDPPASFPERALLLGWAEGARGEVAAVLETDGSGALARVIVRGGSRHNWPLFPDTVSDSFLMDYAINEASWGLSVASHDR